MEHYKSKIKEMYDEIYDNEEDIYNNNITVDEYDTLVDEEPYVEEPYVEEPYVEEPYVDEYNNRTEDEENEIINGGYYESRPNWAKKEKIKEQEDSDEKKAMDSIEWLITNDWGKSNEIEGQASERFKALSFNDSDISNKFLDEINKFTTSLKDKYLK